MLKALVLSGALLFPAYAQDASAPRVEITQGRPSEKAAAVRLKTKVEPIYPESAREKQIEGTVVVSIKIDRQGNVTHATAYTGPDELKAAAIAAVLQWKYEPVVMAGGVVEVATMATIEFKLHAKAPTTKPDDHADAPAKPLTDAQAAALGVQAADNPPAPKMLRVSPGVMQKYLKSTADVEYPEDAKRRGIDGMVSIMVVIDEAGNVTNPQIVSGKPELRQAALDAVVKWKYKPVMLNGRPVAVQTIINLSFQLGH
jgi:TonB family protein